MPYIKNEQIRRLLIAEEYFLDNSDWKENEETEKALWNLWQTIEELNGAKYLENKRAREYMKMKRKTDSKYDRRKKKDEK